MLKMEGLSWIFLKFAENDHNTLTKNLSAELHDKYSMKMMGKKPYNVSSCKHIWS